MSLAYDDNTSLHRLIYFSRATPETIAHLSLAFHAILEGAQKLNLSVGLTGGLLACDGWFLQILEGPRTALLTTFGRIKNDRRHGDIQIIQAGPTSGRNFARWTMCGRQLSPTDSAIVDVFEKNNAFDPHKLTPVRALSMLETIQRLQAKDRDRDTIEID